MQASGVRRLSVSREHFQTTSPLDSFHNSHIESIGRGWGVVSCSNRIRTLVAMAYAMLK